MNIFNILSLAILIGCSFIDGKYISSITENQVRSTGESVDLTCNVENPEGYSVLWVKKSHDRFVDPVSLSVDDKILFREPRFNLTKNGNSYTLSINNIELNDNAFYECQVVLSSRNKEVAQVELLLRRPPVIAEAIEVSPSPVPEGQAVVLKCNSDGYPRPTIYWSRDYDAILPAGGQIHVGNELNIDEVAKEDRGLYICTADNGVEKAAKRSVNLEVEFAPIISTPRPKVAQALDYNIELECKVEAYPAPTVVWFKGEQQIHEDSDYTIITTATVNEVTTSILRVITVEPEQYGDYVCKANNKIGSASQRINLFAQKQPNINFAGLQWNEASSIFNRFQFILNYLVVVILTMILV